MPLFDNKRASKKSLRDIPEGTTEKPKKGPGIIQWIKNSGHSVKGVFLEWLSEQQLFTVVNDEIKMIKKEQQKKKKMSPQEKKTFKQKVAALSDDAIKKFGELYLGTNSSQEAKEKIKEGIQTVLGQIKSGNFYQKTNQFGDEEFDAFMDDLEDEWDDDQESSGEVFMLDDIMDKKGFGEFMKSGSNSKIIKEVIKDEAGDDIVIILNKNNNDEITDIQKYTLQELKDPELRDEINEFMKNKVSDYIEELSTGEKIVTYGKIKQFTVDEDGTITCKIFIDYYLKNRRNIRGSVEYMDLKTKLKYTGSESSRLKNILYKHGFGEMVKLSEYHITINTKKTKKSIDSIIYKSGFGEFLKPGKPKFQQEEIYDQNNEALQVFLYYPKGETEINDVQKSILANLKDPKERAKINKIAKNQLIKNRALDDEDYIIKYDKIASFEVTPDGVITGTAYGYFTKKDDPEQKPTYDEIGYDVEITRYEEVKK